MIDDPNKTDLLMAMLKESLPIQTIITPYLASALAKQSPDIPIPGRCNVIDVFYTGDMGGNLRKPVLHLPDIAREARTPLIGSIAKESPAARTAALLGRAERSSLKAA